MTTCVELTLRAVPGSVREARGAVADTFAGYGAPEHLVEDARLCVSEAVTNAVLHAYGSDGGDVAVRVELDDHALTVVVRDEGRGLGRFREDGELGYGLRIIEQLATHCTITSAPGVGTEVRMVFALGAREASMSR
jgi:anti-sigma regulatory factor (Ser/Thr protein kinase)